MNFGLQNEVEVTKKYPPDMLEKFHGLEDLFAENDPEMDTILQEILKLDSADKLDNAAIEKIQRRIQNKGTSEITSGIAKRPSASNPWTLSKKSRLPVLVLPIMFFVVIGALLEAIIGKQFISSAINEYWQFIAWIIGVLAPLLAWGVFLMVKNNHFIKSRYPTWSIRWLVMFPLMVVVSTAMVITAPLGWAALYGWTTGAPTENLEARVIEISVSHPSRWCDQKSKLNFRGASASICVEGRLSGQPPRAGDRVEVSGRLSQLGLFVEQVRKE